MRKAIKEIILMSLAFGCFIWLLQLTVKVQGLSEQPIKTIEVNATNVLQTGRVIYECAHQDKYYANPPTLALCADCNARLYLRNDEWSDVPFSDFEAIRMMVKEVNQP